MVGKEDVVITPPVPSPELNELMMNLSERRFCPLLQALAKVVRKENETLGNVMNRLQQEEHRMGKYRTTDEPWPYTGAYDKEGNRWVKY